MSGPILYVTGTNTGVGKTTLGKLLLQRTVAMTALKPFCSGCREDAEMFRALQAPGVSLDQVNPFHFAEPLTPLLAARREGRTVRLHEVLNCIDVGASRGFPLLIEGAGGLLSPLGEDYSLAEIVQARPGKVCIVATNALGVLNLALLTARQLPTPAGKQAVVLMGMQKPDSSAGSNADLLRELLPGVLVVEIDYLDDAGRSLTPPAIDALLDWWLGN